MHKGCECKFPLLKIYLNYITEFDKTLLIVSSIIHGINPKGLKKGVFKHAKSGAGIQQIAEELQYFDLGQFNKIIVYIGGNDISRGITDENFQIAYTSLVDQIRQKSPYCELLLCELAPRSDVDVTEINMIINDVASKFGVTCLELFGAFLKRGYRLERYYAKDGIHL